MRMQEWTMSLEEKLLDAAREDGAVDPKFVSDGRPAEPVFLEDREGRRWRVILWRETSCELPYPEKKR